VAGTEVTSTIGPDPVAGDIIPQMFLSFIGSAIYIRTSPLSRAATKITISSSSPKSLYTNTQVNSSVGWISAVGLPQDIVLTLAITYVPDSGRRDGDGGRLDIQFITISVANTSATSSFLPLLPLPATRTPPIYSYSQTPTSSVHKQSKGAIIGESLASALGVVIFASVGTTVVLRRRKRIKMRIEASEQDWGDYDRGRHVQRAQEREASKWF